MNCGNLASELKSIKGSKVVPHKDGIIYWHIRENKLTSDIDKYKVILAFENGFKILEKYFYPIQFKSTGNIEEAPILLGFYKNGDTDLPQKFDSSTLAFAYANYEQYKHSSDIFFNDAYKWAEMNKTGQEINLCKVFVHECLHALGFDHSDIQTDILFWQYQSDDQINFSNDTQLSIKERYKDEMARVPGIVTARFDINEAKEFCKSIIQVKENKLTLGGQTFVNLCRFFGLSIDRKVNSLAEIRDILIKYLYA